jgi:hypothetical protein
MLVHKRASRYIGVLLESEEGRLPLSWGNACVLRLLSSTHLEKGWLVLNLQVCPLLVCTTSRDWHWSREQFEEILLLADSLLVPFISFWMGVYCSEDEKRGLFSSFSNEPGLSAFCPDVCKGAWWSVTSQMVSKKERFSLVLDSSKHFVWCRLTH